MGPHFHLDAGGTLVMLPVCHPRWGHLQGAGVPANWCRYGERNDKAKRHDEGGKAVVARSDALHRGSGLRAGRETLLSGNLQNRQYLCPGVCSRRSLGGCGLRARP